VKLAIRFDEPIRDGDVSDYAELAKLGHVPRTRVTQIMNLLMLAPDIPEAILYCGRITNGNNPIVVRPIQHVALIHDLSIRGIHGSPCCKTSCEQQ
jgi:hypothetical protein